MGGSQSSSESTLIDKRTRFAKEFESKSGEKFVCEFLPFRVEVFEKKKTN